MTTEFTGTMPRHADGPIAALAGTQIEKPSTMSGLRGSA